MVGRERIEGLNGLRFGIKEEFVAGRAFQIKVSLGSWECGLVRRDYIRFLDGVQKKKHLFVEFNSV
jgi:hypothetical protein